LNFFELLKNAGYEKKGLSIPDFEVSDIASDIGRVGKNSVFVAVKGASFDGNSVIETALEKGAGAVFTEYPAGRNKEFVVDDAREANARLCRAFFGAPFELTTIAVTGTNGKTTVTTTIYLALENVGIKSGLIGTVEYKIGESSIPAKFTTPESYDFFSLLRRMRDSGCDFASVEVSSQALAQKRVCGEIFDIAVFTNLSADHLDYHKDMQSYYSAKKLLFSSAKKAVINIDDEYGKKLSREVGCEVLTFSMRENADYTASDVTHFIGGTDFILTGKGFRERVCFPISGDFSVYNAAMAVIALIESGFKPQKAAEMVSSVKSIKGRNETIISEDEAGFTVILDFAHTAEALDSFLSSIKKNFDNRMVVLFGAAGDRDPSKRADMSEVVAKYADFIVVTSDNPRTENEEKIIDELCGPLDRLGAEYIAEKDREKAIEKAMDICREGDILLLCGKGHEDYQVFDGYTVYFDEREIARSYLKEGYYDKNRN
jgi:UDP-N-acetylmuramoyl-L-alanyl-D-glutamate--2,6-diaminopimelate ligase